MEESGIPNKKAEMERLTLLKSVSRHEIFILWQRNQVSAAGDI